MKLGLLGAGAVGAVHAQAAAELPTVNVAAVCSRSVSEAEAVAEPHGARVYSDYREMFDSDLDAVVISTPHSLHTHMVLDAAAAGLQVLLEKPMATTVADCDLMIEACEAAGVALAVGHIQHFLPEKVAAYDAVRSGRIGVPRLVHDLRSTDYRPGTRPEWFFDRKMAGGGAVMNIGSHCIDRSSWLAGALVERVEAASTVSRFGVGVETDATALLTMANGLRASITVTSTPPRLMDEVTVVGDEGTIVADSRRGTVVRVGDTEHVLHERSEGDIPTAFRNQLASFVEFVDHGAPFPVSTSLSRTVVAAVHAIYESAGTGLPVTVETRQPTGAAL
ncbi:Gfo/Idh/MocA family protein [Pseudactinotalea sp. Z1739]|uniref:Gfo/Idh/MocA family protein n=1 Tax=Pseudactinotalea sp. Z1739 TaxID=3413028 RepID=UPI003C7B24E9